MDRNNKYYNLLMDALNDYIDSVGRDLFDFIYESDYDGYYDGREFCNAVEDYGDYSNIKINPFFSVNYGCSKCCLIPNDTSIPYVLKFGVFDPDSLISFCELEADNYVRAKNEGLDFLFAKTEYFTTCYPIGEKYPIKVFISDRIEDTAYNLTRDLICDEELEKVYDSHSLRDNSPMVWGIFDHYYNEDTVLRLIDFANRYYINDIYTYNIGVRNNLPVIFDYSGC